jgi:hypothetical protein
MRWAHAGLVATTVAVLAMSPLPSGFTPELPSGWHGGRPFVAVAGSDSMRTPSPTVDRRLSRKRVVHERPARMIDDAVRRRAMEAVRRALESENSSPA